MNNPNEGWDAEAKSLAHEAMLLTYRSADGTGNALSPKEAIAFAAVGYLKSAYDAGYIDGVEDARKTLQSAVQNVRDCMAGARSEGVENE